MGEKTPLLSKERNGVPSQEDEDEQFETTGSRCCSCMHGVYCKVYISHALSAWGDRMWSFAVGLFLIYLTKDSLQLTAIYGFTGGAASLVFGAVIGDWVDRNPRLRVARTSLVLQNVFVIICSLVLCALVWYDDLLSGDDYLWYRRGGQALVIVLAVLANLASIANTVSIEKDWVVEICGRDKIVLTDMCAVLRRIDLMTKILAPLAVGQIMTYLSMMSGAIFIAGWNFVSLFVEYYLIWRVYVSVPRLAYKETKTGAEENQNTPTRGRSMRVLWIMLTPFTRLYKGWRCYWTQSVRFAGLALALLFMTVLGFDNITTGYAYSQGMTESVLGILTGVGSVFGITGTFGFQYLRPKLGLARTGILGLCVQIMCLTLCLGSIWAPGSPFDPFFAQGNSTSGNDSLTLEYYDVIGVDVMSDVFDNATSTTTSLPPVVISRPIMSLALLMTGIITARFGLWMADMSVTQLLIENVAETERGAVNGVQTSMNRMMDMIKFILVIVAPRPETFGILIIVSFVFICFGLCSYIVFLLQSETSPSNGVMKPSNGRQREKETHSNGGEASERQPLSNASASDGNERLPSADGGGASDRVVA